MVIKKALAIDSLGIQRRSMCPTNYLVEVVGDKWSLLIMRDMLFNNKHTFGEFLNSNEAIARNILSSKLRLLELNELITKQVHPTDGRKDFYDVTRKGKDLEPVLDAMANWSFKHERMTTSYAS
jgi:DNA-binding HxlR family transcriptional regulator